MTSQPGIVGRTPSGAPPEGDPAGIVRLADRESVPQSRAPILEGALERAAKSLEVALRRILPGDVETAVSAVGTARCRTYLDAVIPPALPAILRTSWGGPMLAVLAPDLVAGLVELLLGAPPGREPTPAAPRPLTAIETRVARRFLDEVALHLQDAISPIAPVRLAFERFEPVPRFVDVGPPAGLALSASLSVRAGRLAGAVEILLPHATLDPVPELLGQAAEAAPADAAWTEHLRAEALRAGTVLTAFLHEQRFPLREVMDLAVGATLMFDRGLEDPIELRCGTVPVATGKLGRHGRQAAVKVLSVAEGQA